MAEKYIDETDEYRLESKNDVKRNYYRLLFVILVS